MKTNLCFGCIVNSRIPRLAFITLVLLVWSGSTFSGEIHEAAEGGNLAKVKALLLEDPNLINARDNQGRTSLWYAKNYGHKNMYEFLRERGATK